MKTGIGQSNIVTQVFSRCLISPCSSHFDNHLYIYTMVIVIAAITLFEDMYTVFMGWRILISHGQMTANHNIGHGGCIRQKKIFFDRTW